MKTLLSSTIIALVAILAITTWARAQAPGDRPLGVDEDSWIAISDTVGIVIVDIGYTARTALPSDLPRALSDVPQSTGVLMVKVNELWTRVELAQPPPRLQPVY
jgi:hypothetical protein